MKTLKLFVAAIVLSLTVSCDNGGGNEEAVKEDSTKVPMDTTINIENPSIVIDTIRPYRGTPNTDYCKYTISRVDTVNGVPMLKPKDKICIYCDERKYRNHVCGARLNGGKVMDSLGNEFTLEQAADDMETCKKCLPANTPKYYLTVHEADTTAQ